MCAVVESEVLAITFDTEGELRIRASWEEDALGRRLRLPRVARPRTEIRRVCLSTIGTTGSEMTFPVGTRLVMRNNLLQAAEILKFLRDVIEDEFEMNPHLLADAY